MSRGYQVRWLTESRTITAADHCACDIDLLGILPEGDMVDLLKTRLAASGWKAGADGQLETTLGAVSAVLSQDGRKVELRLQSERTVTGRAETASGAARSADAAAKTEQGSLQSEVVLQLMRAEPEVRARIQSVLKEVYIEALKKKAQSLGSVQSISETEGADGEIELVIRVTA